VFSCFFHVFHVFVPPLMMDDGWWLTFLEAWKMGRVTTKGCSVINFYDQQNGDAWIHRHGYKHINNEDTWASDQLKIKIGI
jgi:hypothetical protein